MEAGSKAFDLEIVETTSSRTGYPEGLRWALTGFKDWEEAEEAAKALDGEIISLRRRDGQQLWTHVTGEFSSRTRARRKAMTRRSGRAASNPPASTGTARASPWQMPSSAESLTRTAWRPGPARSAGPARR